MADFINFTISILQILLAHSITSNSGASTSLTGISSFTTSVWPYIAANLSASERHALGSLTGMSNFTI